ncbi:M23 family metallopeptidase [Cryobacterium sp. PH31-L1]|uniref:M23 family metallopeptidase n=1 Tax=Cryobacterium sp. PH31-L1 TaxID=3046199 RepID=UPI0024BAF308|nr:M23 family metallopeptidase [Cryobacterium sp. PH31-L1]MDJ0378686.1 M23 family metallopeptidase [Cryobacterium sp. PH31-L1]
MQNLRALAASALVTVIVVFGAGPASDAVSAGTSPSAAATITNAWRWPLAEPHRLIRGFVAPESQYSGGHRGIDLAAAANEKVFAAHEGVVSFAGRVVDRSVLSIMQPDDVITTVEPVDAVVAVGDQVRAGQLIGTVASGGHCPPGCLHLGVRQHGWYVSPLLFLGNVPRAVLLPSVP